jgi:hypothetical protein
MNRDKLGKLTIEELVEGFVVIALEQDKALRHGQHAKYNRLFDQMETIKQELQERTGDQRQALVALHSHPNALVRLKSAIATLALAPEAAQRTLQASANAMNTASSLCSGHDKRARQREL